MKKNEPEGFKEVKAKAIKCLEEGAYAHEARNEIEVKNLFLIGQLSEDEVIELIKCCRGNQYEKSTHHFESKVIVHILKPKLRMKNWYIKFYFVDPNVMFISVHESGE